MRRTALITMIILMVLVSACSIYDFGFDRKDPKEPNIEATLAALSTQNAHLATQVQELASAAALATYVPYLSTQIGSLRLTPTPPGDVLPTASPLLPPPGLVYSSSDGLWQVAYDGSLFRLLDRSDVLLSPDGNFALFTQYDPSALTDLWIIDLSTGAERQLTNTPDRLELFGLWWPGQPDKVILGSRPISEEPEPSTGYLSMVSIETGEYRVLDEENMSNAYPAPAPDGQKIAYDRGGEAWIYDLISGPEPFDPSSYSVSGTKDLTIASPSWSPNDKQLAWIIGGGLGTDGSYRLAIAIFDLEAGTSRILHPYYPVGRGGWPPAPVWSPNGQWLALNAWSEENPNALWVLKVDGSEEHYLGDGYNPLWSPDGSHLAFTRYDQPSSIWLVRVGEWKAEQVYLPPDSSVKAWFPPDE